MLREPEDFAQESQVEMEPWIKGLGKEPSRTLAPAASDKWL